ncbi:hypothetical protein SCLCIDRAFT_102563 [Scleroderma citrinum Foug A]|uniref:Uncharacterized protein n=1 Tax=Scleroderma citrinum Foug A TaxID=1036808 RepID=A0A0C3A6Y8_9AGAM|nr:hypothetical protein SCLCIDRAFT_102563 [Scleroderma citrinum Foug A]
MADSCNVTQDTPSWASTTVQTENRSRPCGEPIQSRHHIVATCPLHGNQCHTLKDASEDLATSSNE